MPVNELENLISSCVKSALRYPPVQQSKERLLTEQQAADFLEIPEPALQAELYGNDLTLNHKSGGSNG